MFLFFIESDLARKESLDRCAASLTVPRNFEVHIERSDGDQVYDDIAERSE